MLEIFYLTSVIRQECLFYKYINIKLHTDILLIVAECLAITKSQGNENKIYRKE